MGLTTSGVSGIFHAVQPEMPSLIKKEIGSQIIRTAGNTYTFRLDPSLTQFPVQEKLSMPVSEITAHKSKGVLHTTLANVFEKTSARVMSASNGPSISTGVMEIGLVGSVMAAAPRMLNVGGVSTDMVRTTVGQLGKNAWSFIPNLLGQAVKAVPGLNTLALTFMPRELGDSSLPLAGRLNPEGLRAHSPEPGIHVGGTSDHYPLPIKEEYLAQPSKPQIHGGALPPSSRSLTAPPNVAHVQNSFQDLFLFKEKIEQKKPLGEGDFFSSYLDDDGSVLSVGKDRIRLSDTEVDISPEQAAAMTQLRSEIQNDLSANVFPGVLPRSEVIAEGVMKTPFVGGKAFSELATMDARVRAMSAVPDAVGKAMRHLDLFGDKPYRVIEDGPLKGWRVKVDGVMKDFRFDDEGNLSGLFDIISIFPPGRGPSGGFE